ncbi:MAG: hypothetical protein GWN94_19810 [Phycisphaerae bacterium]|nr:hypothetical protein [Phycisphaerae bacterium]NIS53320.1 hypothetical protein [Phycisphaerae bacterium]NIX30474.1 hypothetical protein [Phycisphaerae bacterium]
MEYQINKAHVFKKTVIKVRSKLTRLWYLIRRKSWQPSTGLKKGDIIKFKGVDGICDGDYEITGETGEERKNHLNQPILT